MASKTIANLMVVVGANLTQFEKGLLQSEKKLKKFGRDMKATGDTLTKTFTLPLLAVGGAAMAAANEMDKGYDAIRAGTGATGAALKELEGNMRSVMKTVPEGAEMTGQAIADLNTRTGQTGKALEDLTFQMLNLGRVSGEEVPALIASTTRVFGDWSIATDKQASTLDYLFKVSQSTGIGVDQLSQRVVQFGAPMRQMGFDFETTAALMGKFEKEGVNTELVVGSLRIALGKMAREGINDPARALQTLIRRIQEAGTTGQANAIALEAFGARAGPDMAAAIREGRFEIDALLKQLADSDETINAAAKETMSFSEHMGILRNQANLALEPLGKVLLDLFQTATPHLQDGIGKLEQLTQKFAGLDAATRNNYLKVLGGVLVGGPLLSFLGNLAFSLKGVIDLFKILGGAKLAYGLKFVLGGALTFLLTNPVALFALALAGILTTTKAIIENWDKISNKDLRWTDPQAYEYAGTPKAAAPVRGGISNLDNIMTPANSGFGGLGGIERYATGGVVPGAIGSPRMAIVHGGEEVLTPQQRGRGGVQHVQHSGTITVRGVNDKNELVGVTEIVAADLARENRRIFTRTALAGIG